MALKVHLMGPRSDKFPYKSEGSWFIKIDNKIHQMLLDRCSEKGETLEEALLSAIVEGAELMRKDWDEANKRT